MASPDSFFPTLNNRGDNFLASQGELTIPLVFCKELLIATGHNPMMSGLYPKVERGSGKMCFTAL